MCVCGFCAAQRRSNVAAFPHCPLHFAYSCHFAVAKHLPLYLFAHSYLLAIVASVVALHEFQFILVLVLVFLFLFLLAFKA